LVPEAAICLAIAAQLAAFAAGPLDRRSVVNGDILSSKGVHVGVVVGDEVFGLNGQKLYDLKGSNIYKLNGDLVGRFVRCARRGEAFGQSNRQAVSVYLISRRRSAGAEGEGEMTEPKTGLASLELKDAVRLRWTLHGIKSQRTFVTLAGDVEIS
jgi:hypothetical protein